MCTIRAATTKESFLYAATRERWRHRSPVASICARHHHQVRNGVVCMSAVAIDCAVRVAPCKHSTPTCWQATPTSFPVHFPRLPLGRATAFPPRRPCSYSTSIPSQRIRAVITAASVQTRTICIRKLAQTVGPFGFDGCIGSTSNTHSVRRTHIPAR